ncbi:MAG: type II toxin-antitoxin system HigB family toxin, partial [Stellaceae bacterium]
AISRSMRATGVSGRRDRNTMCGSPSPAAHHGRHPEEVKASHPRASILRGGRVVFNIKGNDYRLVAALQYRAGVLVIRFFGSHAEYDRIDAETV